MVGRGVRTAILRRFDGWSKDGGASSTIPPTGESPPHGRSSMNSACADVARHISCDAANVELVALKAADDGKGYVVRFRETEGRPVQTRIRQDLVRGAKYVLADLLERGRTPLSDGEFKMAPFAFAQIRISLTPCFQEWTSW